MLLMTKEHHKETHSLSSFQDAKLEHFTETERSPYTRVSHFLPTSKKIVQFSEGREPKVSISYDYT
jgi:ethanolamine-phosphate cytidylyltransferase